MRQTSIASRIGRLVGVIGVGVLATGAMGQSLNIRYGTAATAPSSAYAAAGLPGMWNSFLVTPGYVRQPLVSLQGTPIAAQYYQYGNSTMLTFNNPLTSGQDEKLMDSMMLSANNPVDGCFWIQGLMPGTYQVTIYAMTPNEPSRMSRTRVDDGTPGPVMVGGTWPGQHQAGVTYARFTVTTTDGTIAFHDGLYGGVLQSGMNGVQFQFLGTCPNPTISMQPAPAQTCPSGPATFSISASSNSPSAYQWQKDGVPINPASNPSAASRTLMLAHVSAADAGSYDCIVSNACGRTMSNPATLTVCIGDFNCDGGIDGQDVEAFFVPWEAGETRADVNQDGGVDGQDVEYFFVRWEAVC